VVQGSLAEMAWALTARGSLAWTPGNMSRATAEAAPVQAGKARSAAVQEAMPVAQLGLEPAQTGG